MTRLLASTTIAILTLAGRSPLGAQAPAADVEPASLMTTPVFLMNGGQAIQQGTGFFFASTKADGTPDTVFLVTNYHVVTGRTPSSKDPGLGDSVQFLIHEDRTNLARVRHLVLLHTPRRRWLQVQPSEARA